MPYYICPRCTWRGSRTSRTAGFSDRPPGCENCGFGFLFELLDDYYPSPLSGIIVCDNEGRVLAFGKGADVLTGFQEFELLGIDLEDALELRDENGTHPHKDAVEWGVRKMGESMSLRAADGVVKQVTGDFFPAYDDDGGLLAVFTPRPV